MGWSTLGIEPSIFSVDSRESDVPSIHPQRTPLRSNRSATGLQPVQLLKSKVKSYAAVVEPSADDDDFSLVSGLSGTTSRTLAGIRNVAGAFAATPGSNKGLFDSLLSPSAQTDVFASPRGDEKTPLPPGKTEEALKALTLTSVPPDPQRGSHAVSSSDPDACRAWLYKGPDEELLCLGTIGRQGMVCVRPEAECTVKSHSRKSKLDADAWYILTQYNGATAVKMGPSLPNSIGKTSELWRDSKDEVHYAANWESLMCWVKENSLATSPSDVVTKEAAAPLLQDRAHPGVTVPKTPAALKSSWKGLDADARKSEVVAGLTSGFENTEAVIAEVYAELARLSARIGAAPEGIGNQSPCFP